MRQFKTSLGAFAVIVVLLVSQLLTASSAHAAASKQTNSSMKQMPTSAFSLQLPWPTGQQHSINGGYTYGCGDHTGRDYYAIDFNLPANSQVSAIMAGTAHTVYGKTGYGNYIWILHSGNFVSLYGHLNSFAVADGTSVSQGQLLGLSGSTGNSTGPHLHFTLHSNATTQSNGSAYKPEPMSGYTGFGNYGYCTGRVSPLYTSTSPTPPPPTMVKTASAVPSPSHHPADFSLHAGTQVAEYNSTTNSFAFQGVWVQPVGAIDWAAAGDFNGDGKADFALHANNAIYVYLSTGNSFAFQGSWVSPVGAFDSGWLADFNGS